MRAFVTSAGAGGGDLHPLLALTQGLAERGHDVQLLGDATVTATMAGSSMRVNEVASGLQLRKYLDRFLAAEREGQRPTSPFRAWAADVWAHVSASVRDLRPDVVLSNIFTLALGDVVRGDLNVPLCYVRSTFYVGPGARRPLDQDAVLAKPIVRMLLAELGSIRPDLHIQATDPVFDPPPDPLPEHVRYVGPLFFEGRDKRPGWLDEPGDPWVLVTLSSHRQPGELDIARVALDCLSRHRVRVVLTLSDEVGLDGLGDVPAGVRVERYVPHSHVLRKACMSLSHAGHGIVSKSLFHGVPMVLVPWDRDQPGVAARAEALGAAKVVRREELDRDTLGRAIDAVLSDDSYLNAAREASRRLQAQDAVESACHHVETLTLAAAGRGSGD